MTDGVNIDWGLARPAPDYIGGYQNAFEVGRQMARSQGIQGANQQFATDPQGAVNAMRQFDPVQAQQLQSQYQGQQDRASTIRQAQAEALGTPEGFQTALTEAGNRGAAGDVMDLHKTIAGLGPQQQAAALQKLEALGAVTNGMMGHKELRNPDGTPNIPARLSVAQHFAKQNGVDPSTIKPEDLTDEALTAFAANLKNAERASMTPEQRQAASKPLIFGKDQHVLVPSDSDYAQQAAGGASGAQGAAPTAQPAGSAPAAPQGLTGIPAQVAAEAQRQGVDPNLALSIAHAESRFNPSARSPKGALGVMQLMPHTAQGLGVDPTDPADNIKGGIAYLKQLSDQFHGDPRLIAAAYNAGPGAVTQHGGVPPYAETQKYVENVTGGASPYQVASNGATPPPPSYKPPAGYVDLNPGVGEGNAAGGKRMATPAELKAKGYSPTDHLQIDDKGNISDPPKGATFAGATGPATGDTTKTGADYLASLAPGQRAQVQMVIDGRQGLPENPRTPQQMALQQDVALSDPTYSAAIFKERNKTFTDSFSTAGRTAMRLRATSTAMDHAATLLDLINKLGNNDTPVVGGIINSMQNAVDPQSRSLSARMGPVIQQLAIESAAAAQGGAPHEGEVQGYLETLRDSNSQPTEQKGALRGLIDVLTQRLKEEQNTYDRSRSSTQSPFNALSPDAREAAAKINVIQQRLGGTGKSLGGGPKVGAVEDGHRFNGGDPSKPSSWTRVQ